MNYLIKPLLKRLISSYLNLYQDIDLETSGTLKLAEGTINHEKINLKMDVIGLQILQSKYKNLIGYIPITEIMSKPIKISIEELSIVIKRKKKIDQQNVEELKKSKQIGSESSLQETIVEQLCKEAKQQKQNSKQQKEETSEPGYLKNLLSRLLYNIELYIQNLQLTILPEDSQLKYQDLKVSLRQLNLKNSLVILEANIIKKSLTLGRFEMNHSLGGILLKDINLCFDYNLKKIGVIAVGDQIQIDSNGLTHQNIVQLIVFLGNRIKKKLERSKEKSLKRQQKPQISIYLQLKSIRLNSELIKIKAQSLQIKLNLKQKIQQFYLYLSNLKILSSVDQIIMSIDYLPSDKGSKVKLLSEHEESIIKTIYLSSTLKQKIIQDQIHDYYDLKAYHIGLFVYSDAIKVFADKLIGYQTTIKKIAKVIKKFQNKYQNKQHIKNDTRHINLVAYRNLIKIHYSKHILEAYGTISIKTCQNQTVIAIDQGILQVNLFKLIDCGQLKIKVQSKQSEISMVQHNMSCQMSVSLIRQIKQIIRNTKRDVAYYGTKFNYITQPQKNDGQKIQISPKFAEKFQNLKIFAKISDISLAFGEIISSNPSNFNTILQMDLSPIFLTLSSGTLQVKTQLMFNITSPHTLERSPLTNEIKISMKVGINGNQFKLRIRNNVIILMEDQFLGILLGIGQGREVCMMSNWIGKELLVEQQYPEDITNKQLSHYLSGNSHCLRIKADSTVPIFFLSPSIDFRTSSTSFTIYISEIEKIYKQSSTKTNIFWYEFYEEHTDIQEQYILRLKTNKMGNLQCIDVCFKYQIFSLNNSFEFSIGKNVVKVMGCSIEQIQSIVEGSVQRDKEYSSISHNYHFFEDIVEQHRSYCVSSSKYQNMTLKHLLATQKTTILGIQCQDNLYNSYLLCPKHQRHNHQIYLILPFLIIKNKLNYQLILQIIDKKTGQLENIVIDAGQSIEMDRNKHFDYYMKQFTIKIKYVQNGINGAQFQSQSHYFNTYFTIDQVTESIIKLDSQTKKNYTKKQIILQQSLIFKTKQIIFKPSFEIHNSTSYHFNLKQRKSTEAALELNLPPNSTISGINRFKIDEILQLYLNHHQQTKIEFYFGQLRQNRTTKVLSFNFCRVGETNFYHLLFKIQAIGNQNIQKIEISNFIELHNLGRKLIVSVDNLNTIKEKQNCHLILPSTFNHKYNNKLVQIENISDIYNQIFLNSKVSAHLILTINDQKIPFQTLLKNPQIQQSSQNNRQIFSLLKDMNNNKITFYLTNNLFNSNAHYTIFNNNTDQYFLMMEEQNHPYERLFIENPKIESQRQLQKVLVNKKSINCFVKENYELLLCDSQEKHLDQINKKVLKQKGITVKHHQFQSLTFIDCEYISELPQQSNLLQTKNQILTKNIQLKFKFKNKLVLSFSIKELTIRFLEAHKIDCLIQDICLNNQQTNQHILRVPEQSYFLAEGKLIGQNFILINNLFVKFRNVIANVRMKIPYCIIQIINGLAEKLGIKLPEQGTEAHDFRKIKEKLKKLNNEEKLKKYLSEKIFLVKNIYIHEIHFSLTMELQNLEFSNVIILPHFELVNTMMRQKNMKNEVKSFYKSNLLAKFPKLSFVVQNFKNPVNTIKMFFNIREAMKQKVQSNLILDFMHEEIPENPYYFSKQRWNYFFIKSIQTFQFNKNQDERALHTMENQINFLLYSQKRYVLITNMYIYEIYISGKITIHSLKELQKIKLRKNKNISDIKIMFKNKTFLQISEETTKCNRIMISINRIVF